MDFKRITNILKKIIFYFAIMVSIPFLIAAIIDYFNTNDSVDIVIFVMFLFPFIFSVKHLYKSKKNDYKSRISNDKLTHYMTSEEWEKEIKEVEKEINEINRDIKDIGELENNIYHNYVDNMVKEKPKSDDFNIEKFARECNEYLKKDDMKEWYGFPSNMDEPEDNTTKNHSEDIVYEFVDIISKSNYDDMEGHDFEYYCADILKKNGFINVTVTQGSGDHGIDVLAEKDDITYAIQCKCYSSNIGNAAVQQAHTGKSIYHKDIAVVLTNRYFTNQAIEEAKALGVKLWDRDKLNEMIEKQ